MNFILYKRLFFKHIILAVILSLTLSSCASMNALTAQKQPAIDDIGIGSSQAEIESLLGLKEKTMILNKYERIDFYKFRNGKASVPRGVAHYALSAGTSGLWEVLGMPFEEYTRRERYLAVTYNSDNVAMDIQEIAPFTDKSFRR